MLHTAALAVLAFCEDGAVESASREAELVLVCKRCLSALPRFLLRLKAQLLSPQLRIWLRGPGMVSCPVLLLGPMFVLIRGGGGSVNGITECFG